MNKEDQFKKENTDTRAIKHPDNCIICEKPLGSQDYVCYSCQDEHNIRDSKEVKIPA